MSTAEIKYPKRFLDLNMNSPVEDSKLAYDEMAACWEKVNMKATFSAVMLHLCRYRQSTFACKYSHLSTVIIGFWPGKALV